MVFFCFIILYFILFYFMCQLYVIYVIRIVNVCMCLVYVREHLN